MRIILTGTPGTGKSTIATMLARRMKLRINRVKDVVKKNKLCEGPRHEVNLRKLSAAMKGAGTTQAGAKQKSGYIIEGHLACEIKLPADVIIILRTHPKTLENRLAKRGYGRKKIEENLFAEMLDYCTQRVEKVYGKIGKKPLELDTTNRTPERSAELLAKAISERKKKLDSVDYTQALKGYLLKGHRH